MTEPHRVLVVLPNWVGDVVLASPTLAALRARFASARIAILCRPYVADVARRIGFVDDLFFWPERFSGLPGLIAALRRARFDLAVLLPNSFRSAAVVFLAGAGRRIGYARDGRSWLLSDRVAPPRREGRFDPISARDYYLALAEQLGCGVTDRSLQLRCLPEDESALADRLGPFDDRKTLIVLNPGGAYGTAKIWPAERFAVLADALHRETDARIVVSGVPREKKIADAIHTAAREPLEYCFDPPLGIGPLMALIRRADLLVTNDTGPRHFAIAFGTPVVTIFGPTDPKWTESDFVRERKVMLHLDCQPCQEKICPLRHHNCMMQLDVEPVLAAARELLSAGRARPADDRRAGTLERMNSPS